MVRIHRMQSPLIEMISPPVPIQARVAHENIISATHIVLRKNLNAIHTKPDSACQRVLEIYFRKSGRVEKIRRSNSKILVEPARPPGHCLPLLRRAKARRETMQIKTQSRAAAKIPFHLRGNLSLADCPGMKLKLIRVLMGIRVRQRLF